MGFAGQFLIGCVINSPLEVEEDEYEGALQAVQNDEGIPERRHVQDGGNKTKGPGESHEGGEFDVEEEADPPLVPGPLLILLVVGKLNPCSATPINGLQGQP